MGGDALRLFAFERDRAFCEGFLRCAGVSARKQAEGLYNLAFALSLFIQLQRNLDEEGAEALLGDAGANQHFSGLALRAFLDERRGDFSAAIGFEGIVFHFGIFGLARAELPLRK